MSIIPRGRAVCVAHYLLAVYLPTWAFFPWPELRRGSADPSYPFPHWPTKFLRLARVWPQTRQPAVFGTPSHGSRTSRAMSGIDGGEAFTKKALLPLETSVHLAIIGPRVSGKNLFHIASGRPTLKQWGRRFRCTVPSHPHAIGFLSLRPGGHSPPCSTPRRGGQNLPRWKKNIGLYSRVCKTPPPLWFNPPRSQFF